ncbi:MAG TPA: nickel pincer cofactor biosynthesis protein LarB [Thermoplasmata archaeon]|nr:nickel pincer cofactor biosynthesis protein LarB [Thermoplasmata archaeon]
MRRAGRTRKAGGERAGKADLEGPLNDIDPLRGQRTGVPEVVLALGKPDEGLLDAVRSLLECHPVLVTKCTKAQVALLQEEFGDRVTRKGRFSGTLVLGLSDALPPTEGTVAVVSAGASDAAVAEEAAISCDYLALRPIEIRDSGIAGLHRVQRAAETVRDSGSEAVIAIAGMEGALPSVLASLVAQPVIAVPTSVGYGTGTGGLAAILAMLNSCVPGVVVVNIDNGFGAAAAARRIVMRQRTSHRH